MAKNDAPSVVTVITMSVALGVGMVFARGGFDQFPAWQIPVIIGGGLLGFAGLVGAGYVVCKTWDGLWYLLKRGWSVRQRNRSR